MTEGCFIIHLASLPFSRSAYLVCRVYRNHRKIANVIFTPNTKNISETYQPFMIQMIISILGNTFEIGLNLNIPFHISHLYQLKLIPLVRNEELMDKTTMKVIRFKHPPFQHSNILYAFAFIKMM